MVFVLPDRWGQGLGRSLVNRILSEARGRGYRRAQLWTQADNLRALSLYAHAGFTPSGRSKDADGQPIVHLERHL